jgi:Flp pilus assembly protein TadG
VSRSRRAQAALEFALAIPVLLTLILGVLDAGRVVVAATSLNNAAREGARYAATHVYDGTCTSANCQVETKAIITDVSLGVDPQEIGITVSLTPGNSSVTVALSYPFHSISPLISSTIGAVTVTANSTMLAR